MATSRLWSNHQLDARDERDHAAIEAMVSPRLWSTIRSDHLTLGSRFRGRKATKQNELGAILDELETL